MRVEVTQIVEINGEKTEVYMAGDAEPGATREQVEKIMKDVLASIIAGVYERIDAHEIDGHLPLVNINEFLTQNGGTATHLPAKQAHVGSSPTSVSKDG